MIGGKEQEWFLLRIYSRSITTTTVSKEYCKEEMGWLRIRQEELTLQKAGTSVHWERESWLKDGEMTKTGKVAIQENEKRHFQSNEADLVYMAEYQRNLVAIAT